MVPDDKNPAVVPSESDKVSDDKDGENDEGLTSDDVSLDANETTLDIETEIIDEVKTEISVKNEEKISNKED